MIKQSKSLSLLAAVGLSLAYLGDHASAVTTMQVVNQVTNDLIYDPVSDMLYASVPSSAGLGGNSIVAINPYTGAAGSPVFVGSEPTALSIGNDGKWLYVSIVNGTAVRRYALADQEADILFNMPNGKAIRQLIVDPTDSSTVAISRYYPGFSPSHAGVAVYDDGVARPTETPGFLGAGGPNRLTYASPATLFGFDTTLSSHTFNTITVDQNGATVTGSLGSVVSTNNATIEYHVGRIYATNGQVIDAETFLTLGTFTGTGSLIEPDDANNRTYALVNNELKVYHNTFYVPLDSVTINGISGSASSLTRFGESGLAFRTSGGQVFLVQTDLVPDAPPLAGDTDADGDVDDTDLASAFSNYSGPGALGKDRAEGNNDGDGDIDDSDLGTAFSNYTGPNTPAASVPEPASAISLLAVSALVLRRRR